MTTKDNKYLGKVKLGPKGQIVIPKEVRDMFGIGAGDTLLLLADKEKGIALERYSVFEKIADMIFESKAKEFSSSQNEAYSSEFSQLTKDDSDNVGDN